jgi:serine/threonine-protein kinase HipA
MKNYCDICGENLDNANRYHSACLRRFWGTDKQPTIELTMQDVLLRAQEMAGKLSISGVQPKLSMTRDGGKLLPTSSGGRFILKPQTQTFPHLPENENVCMIIAGALGIEIAEHCLFKLKDDSTAYVVRRFDRTQDGRKLRCEDFSQILGQDKYTSSLEQIGKRIREFSAMPGLDVQFFFERVLLFFLVGNGDAHLKNFSMLETGEGELRLSPAYDIVCSKLVIPKEDDSALTLNGKQNKLRMGDFKSLATHLQIPPKALIDIFGRFESSADMMANRVEHSHLPADDRDQMLKIFSERRSRIFEKST